QPVGQQSQKLCPQCPAAGRGSEPLTITNGHVGMTERYIEWDRDRLVLAEGSADGQKVSVRSITVLDRQGEGSDTLGLLDGLRKAFPATSEKKRPSVGLVIPRQSVTVQRIQLPQVPDAELPEMIRMQAMMKLTVPLESVCMDFTPLPTKPGSSSRDVLLVTAPADLINVARRTLNDAGCELSGVRVSAYCIAQVLEQGGLLKADPESSAVDVVALLRHDFIELTFVRGTTVIFSHSGNPWNTPDAIERTLRSELTRARLSAAEILGEHRIGRILLVGSPTVTGAISDQLSTRFDQAKIERIDPIQFFANSPSDTRVSCSELLPIAGAILSQVRSSIDSVDLVNPRKAPEKRDLRRVRMLAAVLGLILVFGGFSMWKSNRMKALELSLAMIETENSGVSEEVDAGEGTMVLYNQLKDWSDRDHPWLDRLMDLKESLPNTDRIFVKKFSLQAVPRGDVGAVTVDLYARSEEDILKLERRLSAEGYKLKSSNSPKRKPAVASPDYQWNAVLEIVIPTSMTGLSEPSQDAASVAGS
ncbi:MAG: pilus assembly protein PilM, partial [Planctomycetota bacterium]